MTNADPGSLAIGASDDDLARVHPWLDAAAAANDLPRSMSYGMHVALEEAVMNAVTHAFAPGESAAVRIRLLVSGDGAALVVEDNGRAFDPTSAPATKRPASAREVTQGGRGLTLMRHYCDDMRYERTGDGNRLTLRFRRLQSPP